MESGDLVACLASIGPRDDVAVLCLRVRLRQGVKDSIMIMLVLTGMVTLFLLVYLLAALLRPEWF